MVVVGVAIPFFDLFNKATTAFGTIWGWFGPKPAALVVASETPPDKDTGSTCLELAFSHLPKTFMLGKVQLKIVSTNGPSEVPADQAAPPLAINVSQEVPQSVFLDKAPIEFKAAFNAEKDDDVAYVEFCPTWKTPGTKGELYVQPSFFAPDKTPLPVKVEYDRAALSAGGVRILMVRPKNLTTTIADPTVKPTLPPTAGPTK